MAAAASRLGLLTLALGACTSIAVDQQTFEGTRWQVAAVNGTAVQASGDFHLEFRNGSIGARFGCNYMGGVYAVSGETLIVRNLSSTRMACTGLGTNLEGAASAVLSQPMRWTWAAGQKLTLSNSAGSIALQRAR